MRVRVPTLPRTGSGPVDLALDQLKASVESVAAYDFLNGTMVSVVAARACRARRDRDGHRDGGGLNGHEDARLSHGRLVGREPHERLFRRRWHLQAVGLVMALESQQVDYLFTRGLNGDVSEAVDAEGLTYAVNVQYGKEGELKKRPGLASGITDTWRNHGSLLTTGKDVAMVSSQAVNAWNTAAGSSGKVTVAPYLPCRISVQAVTRGSGNVLSCDGSYYTDGTLSCHVTAWQTDPPSGSATVTPTFVSVTDANTGALLLGPYQLSSGGRCPRVVTLASSVLVFWADSVRDIWATSITFTSSVPAVGSTTRVVSTAANLVNTVPLFDACTDGTVAFVSYRSSGSRAETKRINSSRSVTHTYTEATDDPVRR
jgi:hypothetical protein